jgi:hypothetical protein
MTRRTFLTALSALAVAPFVRAEVPEVKLVIPKPKGLDHARFLRCIAEVETGNRDGLVGRNGERTRWQIKPSVQKEYNLAAIAAWLRGQNIEGIEHWHLNRLIRLTGTQHPYGLAFAWNQGAAAWNSGRRTRAGRDYAARVTNLYYA